MRTHYHIGEFAERCGVSTKTLRFYDEAGVLRPASVDPRTGYRRYLPQQLEEMASILALKNLGVPLAQIRELTSRRTTVDRKALLRSLKREIEQSIHHATQSLSWIDAALDDLENGQAPIPVILKQRPAVRIASIRVQLRSYAEVTRFETELLDAVPPECVGALRGVLWHRCADSGVVEAEPFVQLRQRARLHGPYETKDLPRATLACAFSGLADQSAEQTYIGIRRWMLTRGYRQAGPQREIYLPDMLEIQFPLAS